jgi:hypothetical protein
MKRKLLSRKAANDVLTIMSASGYHSSSMLTDHDIHANHVEAFNAALRRRMAC